jgi:hypothetical protein
VTKSRKSWSARSRMIQLFRRLRTSETALHKDIPRRGRRSSLRTTSIHVAHSQFCARAFRNITGLSLPCMIQRYLANRGGAIVSGRRPVFTNGKNWCGGNYLNLGADEKLGQIQSHGKQIIPSRSISSARRKSVGLSMSIARASGISSIRCGSSK